MENILKKIDIKYDDFSPKFRKLADYIRANYRNIAIMNVQTLSEQAGVSSATVIRFANALGFTGYSEMQNGLKKLLFNYYSSADELRYIEDNGKGATSQLVLSSLQSAVEHFRTRNEGIIQASAELITKSSKVFIAGNQISEVFCMYLSYLLSKYKTGVVDVSAYTSYDDELIHTTSDVSCAVIFALQRYPNRTLQLIKKMNEEKIPMIIVSDSELFPYSEYADYLIYVASTELMQFSPHIQVMSTIYEICLLVESMNKKESVENVKRWEEYVNSNNVYYQLPHDQQIK